jgi:hypothetical protein
MCFSIINLIWFYLMLENKGESERERVGGCGGLGTGKRMEI